MGLDQKTGINFPFYQSQLIDIFGEPNEGQWAKDYLRTLNFAQFGDAFAHVRDYEGNRWGQKIYGNYILLDPLIKVFQDIVSEGLVPELKTYDGCFNIRQMKGGTSLSVHSWGLAVDLNAAENPFGGEPSFSDEFVKCFARHGFEWGGLWGTPDGMHFQLVWTSDKWLTSTNPLRPLPWVAAPPVIPVPHGAPPAETPQEVPAEPPAGQPAPERPVGWLERLVRAILRK